MEENHLYIDTTKFINEQSPNICRWTFFDHPVKMIEEP